MGAKILAVDTARSGLWRQGSVDLMTKAAEACMKRAAVDPKRLGLLINVGVYRDRHLVEPAMSSFVQRRMGARGEWDETGGAFSFDLTNGACGPLTGIMVADGFLRSGRTSHALVVSGDAEPWPGLSVGYDIEPSAAAVLLVPGGPEEGFLSFRHETFTRYLSSYEGRMAWTGEGRKRNWLLLEMRPDYLHACVACALSALDAFLEELQLTRDDVDLLIPSQGPPGLPVRLGEATGLGERVVAAGSIWGRLHTAGIGVALADVLADGRFQRARRVVFLAVGAGITTALAYYGQDVSGSVTAHGP